MRDPAGRIEPASPLLLSRRAFRGSIPSLRAAAAAPVAPSAQSAQSPRAQIVQRVGRAALTTGAQRPRRARSAHAGRALTRGGAEGRRLHSTRARLGVTHTDQRAEASRGRGVTPSLASTPHPPRLFQGQTQADSKPWVWQRAGAQDGRFSTVSTCSFCPLRLTRPCARRPLVQGR
jgi:hypothetical protein